MILRLTTLHENARSALECGGLTPPCSFEIHTDQRAKQGRSASQEPGMNLGRKAASSRRTPRCLRHSHFHGSEESRPEHFQRRGCLPVTLRRVRAAPDIAKWRGGPRLWNRACN